MADVLAYPYTGREQDLALIKAASWWIVWYKNDVSMADPVNLVFASITPCDFPGYVNQNVTFGPVGRNADDNAQAVSTTATVTRSTTGTAQLVYGWGLCYYTGSTLILCRLVKFDTPVSIANAGQQLFATATIIQGECPP